MYREEFTVKRIQIRETELNVSNLVMGCMRIDTLTEKELERLTDTYLEAGVNYFDHADIYGGGACEEAFGNMLSGRPGLRDQILIQSKCGIRNGYFDFSREYILTSVDGILKRLHTDHLDVLLLHRPDALMEPEEVAAAFDELETSGKVRYFGVSNQNPMQIELLRSAVRQKLIINQLQMSLAHTPVIDSGMTVNMGIDQSVMRDGSIMEYSRLKGITLQAWSPFQKGFFEGVFLNDRDKYKVLNEKIDVLAEKYQVTPTAIAVAWLTRHPANIQVVLGTTKPSRVKEAAAGSELMLTREEWYGLYQAAGNRIP